MRGEDEGVMVVDDYGHHPTEIAAVIAAARAGIDRRVVVVFQPHRYSRTSQLLHEFGDALGAADEVVLTDIYAAGEAPIPGVTSKRSPTPFARPRRVRSTSSSRSTTLPAAVAAPGAKRRSRRHAGRRLDRHASAIGFSRRCARAARPTGDRR